MQTHLLIFRSIPIDLSKKLSVNPLSHHAALFSFAIDLVGWNLRMSETVNHN
jgi:hypothetical protein